MNEVASIDSFVTEAAKALGAIDIVVSNVSAMPPLDDESGWRAMFEIDMLGSVRLSNAAQAYLKVAAARSGDAAFTLISSIVAGEPYKPGPYSAVKAAMISYAKGVARTNAAHKVRCNVVSPGNVYFEGGAWAKLEQEKPEHFKDWIEKNPTGRMATAHETAAAVVFLSSPRSAFTTGSNLVVDGCLIYARLRAGLKSGLLLHMQSFFWRLRQVPSSR